MRPTVPVITGMPLTISHLAGRVIEYHMPTLLLYWLTSYGCIPTVSCIHTKDAAYAHRIAVSIIETREKGWQRSLLAVPGILNNFFFFFLSLVAH